MAGAVQLIVRSALTTAGAGWKAGAKGIVVLLNAQPAQLQLNWQKQPAVLADPKLLPLIVSCVPPSSDASD
jgi:hypothetical protein